MKQVLFAAVAVFAVGAAQAQTTTGPRGTVPATTMPAPAAVPTTPNAAGNPAVATTDQTAIQPMKGANSFTMDQARGRLEAKGFTNVTGLEKDNDGVWRGQADRNGTKTSVWVDFMGNVGPV